MWPELFTVPFIGYPVHSYGLMLVVGLLLAMELAKFLARRSGLNPDFFATAGILALISGLIGARIAYVLQFPEDVFVHQSFIDNAMSAANIAAGGLVYYGGFLFAFATLVAYGFWRKMPVMRGMDIVAPAVMIGLAFGRIGCFLNGCCWGEHCELPAPISVRFPYGSPPYMDDFRNGDIEPAKELVRTDPFGTTAPRLIPRAEAQKSPQLAELIRAEHSRPMVNTQIISTITALLIALACCLYYTMAPAAGRVMGIMLILEGLSRALIEGMRVEPTEVKNLTLSMVIGLSIAAGGVVLWIAAGWWAKRPKKNQDNNSSNNKAEPRGFPVQGAIG